MANILVVGSGASGVHFTLTALRKGHRVTLVDIGNEKPPAVLPDASFADFKRRLSDPAGYFLGAEYQGVVLPESEEEYYGLPPSKDYVFAAPADLTYSTKGFAPLFSFARGGLAEAWTAGCYPLNDDDLKQFPISYRDLEPHFNEVAQRIGITGVADDLARFLPVHQHLMEPLRLDRHSQILLEAYHRKRAAINGKLGCYLGRTRVATLTQTRGNRRACDYLGRCIWGCPLDALYTPSQTLTECLEHEHFTYLSGWRADYFKADTRDRLVSLVATPEDGGAPCDLPLDYLILAAGTLSSARIFLRSVLEHSGEAVRLTGLMDNRQILVPFANLRALGIEVKSDSYQYHLLGLGIESTDGSGYIHGQITTLTTALLHPIVSKLPFDLRTSVNVTRLVRSSLGVVNVNFHDTRRDDNYVALAAKEADGRNQLEIHYRPDEQEKARLRIGIRKTKQCLHALGCIVPPGMLHVRPMGAGVHYAGTLPMTDAELPWTTTASCRSRDFENLYLVDGSYFPYLPAKNITFTLMANAVRVAEEAF